MTKTFTILGEPKGKQRPKFTTIAGHPRAITPQQTVNYENLVKLEYQAQCGNAFFSDKQPVFVTIDCFMAIPKSTSHLKRRQMLYELIRPMKKPDWDNVGKIICDSLNGIAYRDDSQITDARVRKFYSDQPRVVVTISDQEIEAYNYIQEGNA